MKKLRQGLLALLLFVLCAVNVQARMTVVLQQQDGVISTINDQRQMITGDFITFSLVGDQVLAQASKLQGERVHILFYQSGNEKRCVDLRLASEPTFDLAPPSKPQL